MHQCKTKHTYVCQESKTVIYYFPEIISKAMICILCKRLKEIIVGVMLENKILIA